MSRLEELETKIKNLYESKNPSRDAWADWLWPNHVQIVGDYAQKLAKRFDIDAELSKVAGLLHDIADIEMSRRDAGHEARSLDIGRELMQACGYNSAEIKDVIDDACRLHSCRDGQLPTAMVGKILATADAMAHFKTNFYEFAMPQVTKRLGAVKANEWALKKIEKDMNDKIFFDEIREEVRPDYEKLKTLFSS